MKTTVIPHGLIGLVSILLLAGCGTLVFPLHKEQKEQAAAAKSQKVNLSAEALAQYSMGVLENSAGNDKEALTRYEAAHRSDPDNVDLSLELALHYFHANQFENMYQLLDSVIEKNPDHVRALQLKALGLRIQGRQKEALIPLRAAVELEPQESIHHLEIASILAQGGNYSDAATELEHALPKVTDRLSIFQALGEIYLRQASELIQKKGKVKLPKTTLVVMKSAVDEFPSDPYLLTQYGDLLVLHRKVEDAIEIFGRIEALNPDDLQIRQKLALNLVAVGDRSGAIAILEGLVKKQPGNSRILYYLAELYEQDEKPQKAIECYQRVIKLNPDRPEAYLKTSLLHLGQSEYEKALDTLKAGQKNIPDDIRMQEMLGYVYITQQDYTNALPAFIKVDSQLKALDKKPLLSNFYLNFAITQQMCGHPEEATRLLRAGAQSNASIMDDYLMLVFRERDNVSILKQSLSVLEPLQDLIPQDSSTYTIYGLIAFHAEENAAALSIFEKAETLAKEADNDDELTSQFYFWLGATAERLHEYEKAEQSFLKAINRQPDNADSHNYLAYMLAEQGIKLDDAADHIGVALAIEPDNAAFLDTRGWIHYKQGKYDDALADIQSAAEKIPEDPTITEHMGDIYLALGNQTNAVLWWEKSLSFDKENKAVAAKLKLYRPTEESNVIPVSETNAIPVSTNSAK